MRPQTIGRTLGIGLRVAGRIAGQRWASPGRTQAPQPIAGARVARPVAGDIRNAKRSVATGVGGLLKPIRRAGRILWLEVTGTFFLLPALVFAPALWRARMSWLHGPDHRSFWAAAIVVPLFLYLSASSFWRARRR